ncbi:MAG: plasmid recombination protein [Bacillota bacterium]|nr:plasmid recombination protein [Bacillota bacterium]
MKNYVVFTVGEKFKDLSQFTTFRQHVLREIECPCDLSLTHLNKILIGGPDIKEDFLNYTKDVHFRKKNVFARDLLLSTSHDYMLQLSESKKQLWIDHNIDFLKESFGEHLRFAIVHKDEVQPLHIHALIVPKFANSKGEPILSISRYFDGRKMLSDWQTKYYEHMIKKFPDLKRGIIKSSAKAEDIRKIYGIINGEAEATEATREELIKANGILKVRVNQLEKQVETLAKKLEIKPELTEAYKNPFDLSIKTINKFLE